MAKESQTIKIYNGVKYVMIPKNIATIMGLDKKIFFDFDGKVITISKMPSKTKTKINVSKTKIAKMLNIDLDQLEITD